MRMFSDAALEFSMYLVKTCVVEDGGVSNNEFQNVIDVLGKVGLISLSFFSFHSARACMRYL